MRLRWENTRSVWSPMRPTVAAIMMLVALIATVANGETAADGAVSAHDFEFVSIDGAPMPLSAYAGRPMVIVNTASRCGFTPQYDGLQTLWERYRDRGLMVVGAPSDAFNQELANEAAVKRFCEVNFGLDFPMTEIVEVRGADAHPFFAWAAAEAEAPEWNFYKYVIDGNGRIIDVFSSSVRPLDAKLIASVERALSD